MLDTKRHWFKWLEKIVAKIFGVLPLTPNQFTYLSGFFAVFTLWFMIKGDLVLGTVFFLIAEGLDLVDGAVARAKNMVTTKGAFLDTIFDRYIEGSVLIGFIFLGLPDIFLPISFWICLAIFGSLVTPYIPAAALEKEMWAGKQLRAGIMTRAERIIFILIALILGIIYPDYVYTTYVIIALAIISNISAIQRVIMVINKNNSCE
ncbi:CDP-alcohol phosphatidyltransferase family protein [bacterium]|jgi:phosphatidylglycerophosphate synthase|nr:CDP-alcohol phosphatidyltransferase family protein [bacterium]